MLKICITGHRNITNFSQIKAELYNSLEYFKKIDENILIYTQLAIGADTLFAETAIELNIPFIVLLPIDKENYIKDFEKNDIKKFEKLLAKANSVEVVSSIGDKQYRATDLNYQKAGRRMIEIADIVIAVWDGKISEKIGGTYDMIKYSQQQHKNLHIIYGVREDYSPLITNLEKTFSRYDNFAIKNKRKFHFFWKSGILLGLLAVVFLEINLFFKPESELKYLVACLEILTILLSYLFLIHFTNKYKLIFLEHRNYTESYRWLLWIRKASFPSSLNEYKKLIKFENDIYLTEEMLEQQLNTTNVFENSKRLTWCLANEQIKYHQQYRMSHSFKQILLHNKFLTILKYAFIFSVFSKIIFETIEYFEICHSALFECFISLLNAMIIFIPSLYAAIEGVVHFNEWTKTFEKSHEIMNKLEELKNQVNKCDSFEKLIIEALNLKNILVTENIQWQKKIKEQQISIKP